MIPVLQNRWKLTGTTLVYYGLPQPPRLFRRRISLSPSAAKTVAMLDGRRPLEDYPNPSALRRLIRRGVVVDVKDRKAAPASLDEARFCRRCAANDYAIPGLELDENGLCPICNTEKRFRKCKNVLPVLDRIPTSPGKKYDAALFYTGGKDSSYLLWHLARVQKLRILALTWETPFMSPWARESIQHAKAHLPEVDFLVERAPDEALKTIYREVYRRQKNVCICPSVAYVLFFQRLVDWEVPFLILGNEPAQCRNLIYNGMAPPITFRPGIQRLARWGVNLGRLLTLRRPFKAGQMELFFTVRQLAFGPAGIVKAIGWRNELVENTAASLAMAPDFLAPFQTAVRQAERSGTLPGLVHVDLDDAAGGRYDWADVKELLSKEIGWVDAPAKDKGLHTSCSIEKCKEWSQFSRFRDMESTILPFSAVELALASGSGSVDRETAISELKHHSGFTGKPPAEWEVMVEALR